MRISSFTRDGLVFDVTDTGPLDGEPVVLLHGFPERSSSWDAVSERLHAAGHRTLAVDQRGYSPGARPRWRWQYRIPELVADVVALADEVGRPVHVVGHDWGAVVGWCLAAHHPDQVASLTAASVPHPGAFLHAVRHGGQLRKSWYIGLFNLTGVVEALVRRRPGDFLTELRKGGMSRRQLDAFEDEVVADGALRGGLSWYRGLWFVRPGWAVRRVRVPTTFVWSDGDVAVVRAGAEDTGRWVEAAYELVVLEGVSHWIPTEAPDALADAVLTRIASVA